MYVKITFYSYGAIEAKCCICQGKTESDAMSLEETLIIAEIMDEIMKQLGVNN